ncbi:MAG: PilZ domain-containing protein [Deltaproteobacteria bacterium]|nr:MAG: PilZ domain-containing protein [Deltaproteobacteria bacterium]
MAPEVEKRIEPRKKLDIYLNKYIGEEPYMVRAADISATGIYLHKLIEPDLPEGTVVSLEFQLPGSDEVIWARGAVMREGSRWGTKGVGVWFTILPKRYRQMIEAYVNSN